MTGRRVARRSLLLGAGLAALGLPARAASEFAYRAWRFDVSAVQGPLPEPLIQSLQQQIDLVESLPLKPEVKAFFREVDVKVDPSTLGKRALYRAQTSRSLRGVTMHRIYLSTQVEPLHDASLLPMLLLAYLDRRVADGWRNARLRDFHEQAKRTGAFSSQSEMMRSPEDLFAHGGVAILRGQVPREPFERAKVRDKLPGFYDWMVAELCPGGAL